MNDKDLISKQLLKRLLVGFGTQLFKLDIVEAELLSSEQPRIEAKRADLVARVKNSQGESYILHVEIQNDNRSDLPLRMLRYYTDIALEHTGEKIVQYLLYIGKAPLKMPDHVRGQDWLYRYKVLDMRSQDSGDFLGSDNPDALVLAILCDPKGLEPNALVAHIVKELRRLHGHQLNSLRDSLKMLDVLAGNRDLEHIVREQGEMHIDPEKLGLYQLVKEKSEAKGLEQGLELGMRKGMEQGMEQGLEKGEQKVLVKLLAKLSPEEVAELSGVPLTKINAIAVANKSI